MAKRYYSVVQGILSVLSDAMLPRSQLTSCSCPDTLGWVPEFIKLLLLRAWLIARLWDTCFVLRQCLDRKKTCDNHCHDSVQDFLPLLRRCSGGPCGPGEWECTPAHTRRKWVALTLSWTDSTFYQERVVSFCLMLGWAPAAPALIRLAECQISSSCYCCVLGWVTSKLLLLVLDWNLPALLRVIKCLAVMCDKMWRIIPYCPNRSGGIS